MRHSRAIPIAPIEAIADKFWARVEKGGSGDCWPWSGSRQRGYGVIRVAGRYLRAHRVAAKLSKGESVEGRVVAHRCDNPPCCNPAHLFITSQAGNLKDMARKGRAGGAGKPKLTEEQVREIHDRAWAGESIRSLAPQYGVSWPTVADIRRHRTWKHLWTECDHE